LLDTRSDISNLSDEDLEAQLYDCLARAAIDLKIPKLAEAIESAFGGNQRRLSRCLNIILIGENAHTS